MNSISFFLVGFVVEGQGEIKLVATIENATCKLKQRGIYCFPR